LLAKLKRVSTVLPIHPEYYSSQDSARKWMGEDVILLYHQISLSWGLLFCASHGSCFDGLPVTKSFDMFFKLLLKFKTRHQKGGRRILLLPLAYISCCLKTAFDYLLIFGFSSFYSNRATELDRALQPIFWHR
jgi:hypothetical protein